MKKAWLLFLFVWTAFQVARSQQDTVMLNEVEIRNFRLSNTPCTVERITPATVEKSSVADAGQLLRSVPNVSGVKKGVAGIDPVIRGFKYSQLNVMIDGAVKIEGGCPNRMDPATAHVDISDIKEINIIKGPFALKYGPSFGGVINLVTLQPLFYDTFQTHVKIFTGIQSNGPGFKSNISINGGNRFFTFQAVAGVKKYGDYTDGGGTRIFSSLSSSYAKLNLGFKINENHIIDGGADFSFGRNIDFPALAMDERDDNTTIYKLNYLGKNIGNKINYVKINSWFSDVHHVMDNKNRPFSDTVVAVSTIDAVDAGVRAALNFNLGKSTLETGIDYEYVFKDGERVKTMIVQPGLPVKNEMIWHNAAISNLGIYTEWRKKVNKISWAATMRLDFNNAVSDPMLRNGMDGSPVYENNDTKSSFTNLSVNAGFNWQINKDNLFTFSLGRGVRSADMTERYIVLLPVGYDHYDYLGNPQLKPEVNYEADISFEHISKLTCRLKPALFVAYVTDYIGSERVPPSEVRPQTKGVLGVKRFVNINEVWLTGFEISWLSPEDKPWHIAASIAYTYGVNPEAVGYKIENGQVVDEYTITNDALPEIPPFEFNTDFYYNFYNGKLVPSLHWRMVAAQKHISESYGEQESKAFQTVDIGLKYVYNSYFTVWGGVNNVFNTLYYEHLNRNIIGSALPLNEPGRNFYINLVIKF
jgi:iron complex outermembrane receptor protein